MIKVRAYFLLILIFITSIGSGSTHSSSIYRLQTNVNNQFTTDEITKIHAYFNHVESLLPEKIKKSFPKGIPVQFKDIGNSHGRASHRSGISLSHQVLEIILNTRLQSELSLDPSGQTRTHKTKGQEVQGTLIHETAHIYDFLNIRSNVEKSFINHCQQFQSHQNDNIPLPDLCEVYLKTNTTISSDPYYLEIAGWPLSVQGTNYRPSHNVFKQRTADALEFKNSIEHFAVNFEYYILDPEFFCRKPLISQYFDQHFSVKRNLKNCNNSFYINPSATHSDNLIKSIPVDRVYQIHYLHADKGSDTMSSWGHSMFRIVICDPKRKSVGPDCLKDELYHIVVSFRAFISTFSINSWKGMTGYYPSRLFIVPFHEVKKNYLQIELRDLFSHPLNLTENEKKRFIDRVLETHWNYDSSYYFLTNNCATESVNLLRSSLLRPELLELKMIKPTDLRTFLVKSNLANSIDLKKNRKESIENGYYFENHGYHYQQAYNYITNRQDSLESAKNHLMQPLSIRKQIYPKNLNLQQIAAISILETAALENRKLKVNESIFNKAIAAATQIRDSYQLSIELFNLFSAPHEFISQETYGIPLVADLEISSGKIKESWEINHKNNKERSHLLKSLMDQNHLDEVKNTENFLGDLVSQLKLKND